jgi:lipopolysaccharide transport system ATP-binding protein
MAKSPMSLINSSWLSPLTPSPSGAAGSSSVANQSTSTEPVICCNGIGKAFQLYAHQNDQLKQVIFGLWKKYYKEKWVLRDISFTVEKGECVGIIGRNGAGKTTLLQVICGITFPTKGLFQVNGRIAPILALGSGFDGLLTGRENARIGAAILGLSHAEVNARIDDIAAFADIGAFFDQPMRTYSMGMISRVAFAVCAHADANILIVDEALSVGDEIFQHKCEKFISDFSRRGTILMVSHDLGSLQHLCDRVLWLDDGIVRQIGDPISVISDYRTAMAQEEASAGVR